MNGDVLYETAGNRLSMAAGSDPQPVESSVVPDHRKASLLTTNPLIASSGVRNHIPYSDHNYGKPLTPPDSCSPEHPEEADTGNEEEGFTRCICGYKHDDGYMICCDKCSAWQHIECVGIKSNSVPETYLCDICHPRPLDKERAKQIQAKKRDEPTDDDDDDSDHDSDNQVIIPNNLSSKENIILTKAGKRKKKENTVRKLGQKEIKHSKRKRRKKKHFASGALQVDEDTNGPWTLTALPNERYKEGIKTLYSGELMKLNFPVIDAQFNFPEYVQQRCKVVDVKKNRKGVVVTEDIDEESLLIECIGTMMLESEFKADHPMFPKYYPFVLYYNKLDHVRLVMNFTNYGNDARHIRRSCSPTAQVRHVVKNSQIRLVVVSTSRLGKGQEVTVAFEFPFQEYRKQLECACSRDNCVVLKHNMAIQSVEQTNGFRNTNKDGLPLLDNSFSNHMDSDSEGDNSNDTKEKRNRKKLSREERKLQAYLRQFEKMEKTEKKRQQTSTGRDGRTGILTQRNLSDEYNCETPTKPGKGLSRKQGLSQRRKIQAMVRRANRLPSCSSEPHSPDDHCSSAASTPTTPFINVVEEHGEVHELAEKSFKFPKFKKGSLNDVSSNNGDHRLSNNTSPITEYTTVSTTSPTTMAASTAAAAATAVVVDTTIPASVATLCKQSSLDDPVVVDVEGGARCDRLSSLDVTYNGPSSPTTDLIGSPSPSHSSYASPTHSESVDIDQSSRHCIAVSPTPHSVASYLLNQRHHKPHAFHATLKKRWLLKYTGDDSASTTPNSQSPSCASGAVSGHPPPQQQQRIDTEKTFPLPYKRRKLMEHRDLVKNVINSRTTGGSPRPSPPLAPPSTSEPTRPRPATSISDGRPPTVELVKPNNDASGVPISDNDLGEGGFSWGPSTKPDLPKNDILKTIVPDNIPGKATPPESDTVDVVTPVEIVASERGVEERVSVKSVQPVTSINHTVGKHASKTDAAHPSACEGDARDTVAPKADTSTTVPPKAHIRQTVGPTAVAKETFSPRADVRDTVVSKGDIREAFTSEAVTRETFATKPDARDPLSWHVAAFPRLGSTASELSSTRCSSVSSVTSSEDAWTDRRISMESVDSTTDARTSAQDAVIEAAVQSTSTPDTVNTQVGSTVDVPVNTTSTGGKKKVSLSEYLNRKRSFTNLTKKEPTAVQRTEAPAVTQSRVSPPVTTVSSGSLVVSSASTHPFKNHAASVSPSNVIGASRLSGAGAMLGGGGCGAINHSVGVVRSVLIEPVSPDESYQANDEDAPKSNLHRATCQDQKPTLVVKDLKPSVATSLPDYKSLLMHAPRPIVEPTGGSSEAMDIDDENPVTSTSILVNTPASYNRIALIQNNLSKAYPQNDVGKSNQQINDLDILRRRHGLITAGQTAPMVISTAMSRPPPPPPPPTNGRIPPPFQ